MKAKGTAAEEEDVCDPGSAVPRPGELRPSQDLAGNSDISISLSLCSPQSPKALLRVAASQKTADEETKLSFKVPL